MLYPSSDVLQLDSKVFASENKMYNYINAGADEVFPAVQALVLYLPT